MLILANSYAPVAPVTPIFKILFLVFIILFEAIYLGSCWKNENKIRIFLHVSIANIFSALVGFLIGIASFFIDILLRYSIGFIFFFLKPATFLYNFIFATVFIILFPLIVWLFCYHVSWRIELKHLSKYIKSAQHDINSVINANKWTYGFLGIMLFIFMCLQLLLALSASRGKM
jgi:hypothetical protein